MFERFTEQARQVVALAQEESRTLKHDYIGTEHLLLGLLRQEEGLAALVLESLDITVERVRAHVVRIVGPGEGGSSGQIPFTPRAKKVLELALRESKSLGHNHIDTEHILLGLARENEGVAMRVLLATLPEGVVARTFAELGIDEPALDAALERARAAGPDAIEDQIAAAARRKDEAIDAGDLEAATSYRGEERRLTEARDDDLIGRVRRRLGLMPGAEA